MQFSMKKFEWNYTILSMYTLIPSLYSNQYLLAMGQFYPPPPT